MLAVTLPARALVREHRTNAASTTTLPSATAVPCADGAGRAGRSTSSPRVPGSWWAGALLALLGANVGAVLALGLARLPVGLRARVAWRSGAAG